jgi:CheY-like chemotaxis protein
MPYVLIVDDDAPTRLVARRFLESAGYDVREATGARVALKRIAESAPAVALSDICRPGPNGLWLADQMRVLSPTTAIVLMTGDYQMAPFESRRKGVVAFVLKPLGREELLLAVEQGVLWSASECQKNPAARAVELKRRGA